MQTTTNDLGIVATVLLALAVCGTTLGALASIHHQREKTRKAQITGGLKQINIALYKSPPATVSNVAGTE